MNCNFQADVSILLVVFFATSSYFFFIKNVGKCMNIHLIKETVPSWIEQHPYKIVTNLQLVQNWHWNTMGRSFWLNLVEVVHSNCLCRWNNVIYYYVSFCGIWDKWTCWTLQDFNQPTFIIPLWSSKSFSYFDFWPKI